MSCFAPTTGSNLRVETVQQVTSDQNTPVSLAGSTFPQFLLLFETLRFSRTMCPHLSPTGFFLGGSGFRVASQSPTTRQFRIFAPMLGLRLSHSMAVAVAVVRFEISPKNHQRFWVGEMGRFPQPPAYQNGSVVVPQTPAVPKAMQGQAPYGGAEKKNLGGG